MWGLACKLSSVGLRACGCGICVGLRECGNDGLCGLVKERRRGGLCAASLGELWGWAGAQPGQRGSAQAPEPCVLCLPAASWRSPPPGLQTHPADQDFSPFLAGPAREEPGTQQGPGGTGGLAPEAGSLRS